MRGCCSLYSIVEYYEYEDTRFGDAYTDSEGDVELS